MYDVVCCATVGTSTLECTHPIDYPTHPLDGQYVREGGQNTPVLVKTLHQTLQIQVRLVSKDIK